MHLNYCVFLNFFTLFFSTQYDFSKLLEVTYHVKVVVSQKLCKIETLLIRTTSLNHDELSNSVISNDLEWPLGPCSESPSLFECSFLYMCAAVDKIHRLLLLCSIFIRASIFLCHTKFGCNYIHEMGKFTLSVWWFYYSMQFYCAWALSSNGGIVMLQYCSQSDKGLQWTVVYNIASLLLSY